MRSPAARSGGLLWPGPHHGPPVDPGRRTHRRSGPRSSDALLELFGELNGTGQTILMVTHSVNAASHAGRVLFLRDGQVYHQLYRGGESQEAQFRRISDTLTVLAGGGEPHA